MNCFKCFSEAFIIGIALAMVVGPISVIFIKKTLSMGARGAFAVGTLLKELYIDSALKKAEKLDEQYQTEEKEEKKGPSIEISWKQFKKSNL